MHLAVCLLDQLLSREQVNRATYQPLALSALSLASKYEEVAPPHFSQLAEIVEDLASKEDLLAGEERILHALGFGFRPASSLTLFDEFAEELLVQRKEGEVMNVEQLWKERSLAHVLLDISLLFSECLKFSPAEVLASSMLIARKIVRKAAPDEAVEVVERLGLKFENVRSCVMELTEFSKQQEIERCKGLRKLHGEHLSDLKTAAFGP